MSSIVQSLVQIDKLSLEEYLRQKDSFGASRQEIKFLVPKVLIPDVIDYLCNDYMLCLSNESQMSHVYVSQYFDTKDFKFFNMHRQGKYNRMKVRVREYKNADNSRFIECKRKVKGVKTLKDRVRLTGLDTEFFNDQVIKDRLEEYALDPSLLEEKLRIAYNRLILVAKNSEARISVDFGIEAEDTIGKKVALLPKHCILEIKSKKAPKDVVRFLKNLGIREESFSKYCISLCMLRDDLKKNKWKQVLKLC